MSRSLRRSWLQHSFIVDNYTCGRVYTLTVNGAIVQKYRGTVGTVAKGGTISTRYARNYWYDERQRYRSPPYFLATVAAWELVRSQEYVNGS